MVSGMLLMEKILFRFAHQWIAGNTISDALDSAKIAYKNGRHPIINRLGEYLTSKAEIRETVKDYQKIVSSFKKWNVRGGISIKPTQIGLSVSKDVCLQNLQKIIKRAAESHTFVWIDMESSDHTDETIGIYYDLFARYERLGIALQANLKRTKNDMIDLLSHGAKIRLVKGAYKEKATISYRSKNDVDKNFLKLMRLLFKKGNEFGIATHDVSMIEHAVKLSKKYERKFEFQMLKGIRDEIKPKLLKKHFVV
ncbi:MAG: Proline dehydrogenase, partial [Nitrosopumilales archaeon]